MDCTCHLLLLLLELWLLRQGGVQAVQQLLLLLLLEWVRAGRWRGSARDHGNRQGRGALVVSGYTPAIFTTQGTTQTRGGIGYQMQREGGRGRLWVGRATPLLLWLRLMVLLVGREGRLQRWRLLAQLWELWLLPLLQLLLKLLALQPGLQKAVGQLGVHGHALRRRGRAGAHSPFPASACRTSVHGKGRCPGRGLGGGRGRGSSSNSSSWNGGRGRAALGWLGGFSHVPLHEGGLGSSRGLGCLLLAKLT
mmetsp:Transcript_16195/g.44287  ORF Transcript_16195/g.44287 Transcript_16195/m.44287 type:complete len:251 (-) Transcript_16195:141-893(-)